MYKGWPYFRVAKNKYMKLKILLIVSIIGILSCGRETHKQGTINVTGTAEMIMAPDEIYVQIDLTEYNKKGNGKVEIETIKNEFTKAAKALGITDSNIVFISEMVTSPGNGLYNDGSENSDKLSTVSYLVKTSKKKMDDLMKRLDNEAIQNNSLSGVSNSNEKEIQGQLRKLAIVAAKNKAADLASAAGVKIGEIILINEPVENIYTPFGSRSSNTKLNAELNQEQNMGDAVSLYNGKIKYRVDINITFALK